jgi:fructose-1,6-bisphosphatase/inositol monophosphatase family enzyme
VTDPETLALDVAQAIRDAVHPHLGTAGARAPVSRAPGGDVTLAIDEVAERVLDERLAAEGDIGFYSEDRGLVVYGQPRAFLVVDPVDGTRPAAAGLESCCVSIGLVPPTEDARLGDVSFGVVQELRTGARYWARRGAATARVHRRSTVARSRSRRLRTSTSTRSSSPRGNAGARSCPRASCSRSSSTAPAWAAGTSTSGRRRSP